MTERETATRPGAPRAGRAGGRAPVPGGAPADSGPAGGEPGGTPAGFSRVARLLRRHWLIGALLLAGLVLRVLAQVAYQPALIYVDTLKYLYGASPGADPVGYMIILRAILPVGNLSVVAAIQHLLGLGLGLALYVATLRQGAPRWLSALAAAPVLLDSYQVQIEQTIMPDIWFEALVVAGLCALLWRPAITVRLAAAAGLVLGCSALVRQIGEVLILPALVFLLVRGGGLRLVAVRAAALCVAFALPVLSYCAVSYAKTGNFWLARGQTMTGRLAAVADCATLKLPAELRPLCPTPAEQAHGPDWLEHSSRSPLHLAPIPPGANRDQLIAELGAAVEHQQPLRVAASIARDSIRLFALTRTPNAWVTPVSRWQFQTYYPTYPRWVSLGPGNTIIVGVQPVPFGRFIERPLRPHYGGPAHVQPAGGHLPALLPARWRVHAGPGARPARPARGSRLGPGAVPARCQPAYPPAGAGLPAVHRHRGGAAARARSLRILLAVRAARRGHPAAGRAARGGRAGQPAPGLEGTARPGRPAGRGAAVSGLGR